MTRKRDEPYPSRHAPARFGKRRRPPPPEPEEIVDHPISKPPPPPGIIVLGLSHDCSVLDLKSRFEIYGSISRIRIERDGAGYIAFRSKDSGDAAIAASLDPSFGITVDSQKVQVVWATDSLAQWREGVGYGANKSTPSTDSLAQWREGVGYGANKSTPSTSSSSKLVRAEPPLRRHGRGNKLASAIVNPRNNNPIPPSVPFKGREIVAYDDIL